VNPSSLSPLAVLAGWSQGEELRRELHRLLAEKSVRHGHFVLASGKESDFYLDCRQVSLHGRGQVLIGKLFLRLIEKRYPQAVGLGGPTLGADPLVSATCTVAGLEGKLLHGFLIRKEPKGHGTGAYIEGMANLPAGSPVVICEDVVTTGGSLLKAVEKARQAELQVLGALALVDRLEGGRQAIEEQGVALDVLFTRRDFEG